MSRGPLLFACAVLLAQRAPLDPAWDLLAKGERQEAARLARRVIEANPRDGEARLFLGSLLAEDGRAAEAIVELKQAVQLMPRSAMAHNALGEAFQRAVDVKAARAAFERAVELDPAFAQARANLGQVLLETGESGKAATHLDLAIRAFGQSPDAAPSRYLRARIYTERNEIEKAESELREAVRLRPDFAEAWSDLGQARKALLDDDGAFAAFERSVAADAENAISQYRLGAELLRRGDARLAERHLRESYRLNPKNQSTLYSLQLALRENGKLDEAARIKAELAAVLRRIDQESQSAFTALRLNNEGAVLDRAGDYRSAVEKYRQAVALDPEHAGFRLNFAVALLRLGQWKDGLAELREAARRDPDNAQVRVALQDALEQAPVAFGGKGKSGAGRK